MKGYKIIAKDGEIGKVDDFYFDDQNWVVRYLVDKTGFWLFGRQILISPSSFEKPIEEEKEFIVSLTKHQVENSPETDLDKPVSKENEEKLAKYYGWPRYWTGPAPGSITGHTRFSSPHSMNPVKGDVVKDTNFKSIGLRSIDEIIGYKIITTDGGFGYVDDFIVDDENWTIRYIVMDTKKLMDGKKILIDPKWINSVDWAYKEISVDIKKISISKYPHFDESLPISKEYEKLIQDYYGRSKYW